MTKQTEDQDSPRISADGIETLVADKGNLKFLGFAIFNTQQNAEYEGHEPNNLSIDTITGVRYFRYHSEEVDLNQIHMLNRILSRNGLYIARIRVLAHDKYRGRYSGDLYRRKGKK